MATVTLNTGAVMPAISLGVWKIAKETTAAVVLEAIKAGYRGFDCACDYGNEQQVGEGVATAIKEGLVKREELFITSKVAKLLLLPPPPLSLQPRQLLLQLRSLASTLALTGMWMTVVTLSSSFFLAALEHLSRQGARRGRVSQDADGSRPRVSRVHHS